MPERNTFNKGDVSAYFPGYQFRPCCSTKLILIVLLFSGCSQPQAPTHSQWSEPVVQNGAEASTTTVGATNTVGEGPVTIEIPSDNRVLRFKHQIPPLVPGHTIKLAFALSNRTGKDLTIFSVSPSCSCTVSNLSSELIENGEQSILRLTYHSPPRPGVENRSIAVRFKEKESPQIIISLQITVRNLITVEPESYTLGDLGKQSVIRRPFVLRNYSSEKWKSVRTDSEADKIFFLKCEEVIKMPLGPEAGNEQSHQTWRGEFLLNVNELAYGTHRITLPIEVETANGFVRPQLDPLSITFSVRPDLYAIPARLYFENTPIGASSSKQLTIRSNLAPGQEEPDLKTVIPESLSESLKVSIKSIGTGVWKLEAVFTPSPAKGNSLVESEIDIVSLHDPLERLRIPILGKVRNP